MKLQKWKVLFLIVFLSFAGYSSADVQFSVGTGNFYVSVGNYDYLPYGFVGNPGFVPPPINFNSMMAEYGAWVSVNPFGQAWRPYAAAGWRPYTYGHWIYTANGPYWQGYEPWAWAGYHYGNWVFSQQYGWIWIPGNTYHNGQVAWAQGYDSIGWMPLPPAGYDYSRGYLSYMGPVNQFAYNDSDFGIQFGVGGMGYSYGGPYYDPRFSNLYYNPAYQGMNTNLWIFINSSDFGGDNYADYYLGPDYVRTIFDRRLVRITTKQPDREVLERVVRRPIREVPVEEKEIRTDQRTVKVVVPKDEQEIEKVRRHGKAVVDEVIAPAFVEKQKPLKGAQAKNKDVVGKVFRQENAQPREENVSKEQVIQRANKAKAEREQRRSLKAQAALQEVQRVEKEGKIRGPKNDPNKRTQNRPGATPPPDVEQKNQPEDQRLNRPGQQNRPEPEDQQLNQPDQDRNRNQRVNPPGQQNRPAPEDQQLNQPDQDRNRDQRLNPPGQQNRPTPEDQQLNRPEDQGNPQTNQIRPDSNTENPNQEVQKSDKDKSKDSKKSKKTTDKKKKKPNPEEDGDPE